VPEKCDLNSILFLMTPAEDESKLNTLIANWSSSRICGIGRAAARSAADAVRGAQRTLRGLLAAADLHEMHQFYKNANVKELQRLCFRASSFPSLRCRRKTPTKRWSPMTSTTFRSRHRRPHLGHAGADYPPGIGVVLPESAGMIANRCSTTSSRFRNRSIAFPGFNYEVQGVYQETVDVASSSTPTSSANKRLGRKPRRQQNGRNNKKDECHATDVHRHGEHDGIWHHHAAATWLRSAISLLSWLVTAVGSMAIAYGFAQAGIFKPAHRRPGRLRRGRLRQGRYFQVFFLYFLSLADRQRSRRQHGIGLSRPFFSRTWRNPDHDDHRHHRAAVDHDGGKLWRPKLTGRIGP